MLAPPTNSQPAPSGHLVFTSTSGRDYLSLPLHSILWIQAKKNYIEFCWQDEEEVYTTLLRSTLKEVKAQLPDAFLQTHRSFIIQPKLISSCTARHVGYALQMGRSPYPIPVSRNHQLPVIQYIRHHLPHLRP